MPQHIVAAGQTISLGYEQITGLSSAKGLTIPDDATFCTIQAEDQEIRFRDDGTAATATVGTILEVKQVFQFTATMPDVSLFETAASAIVNVLYYK